MRNIVLVLLIIALIAGTAIIFTNKPISPVPTQTSSMNNDSMQKDESELIDHNKVSAAGSYLSYSPDMLEASKNTRRVLFFYANWCPTCKPADAEFNQKVNEIPQGVTLIRVNYNDPETDEDEKALAKKYAITYQHTFVEVDSNGKEVKKWNGGGLEELLINLQ